MSLIRVVRMTFRPEEAPAFLENFEAHKEDELLFKKYQAKKTKVEALMSQWEEIQQEIENA